MIVLYNIDLLNYDDVKGRIAFSTEMRNILKTRLLIPVPRDGWCR